MQMEIDDVEITELLVNIATAGLFLTKVAREVAKARAEGYDVDTLDEEQENYIKSAIYHLRITADTLEPLAKGDDTNDG